MANFGNLLDKSMRDFLLIGRIQIRRWINKKKIMNSDLGGQKVTNPSGCDHDSLFNGNVQPIYYGKDIYSNHIVCHQIIRFISGRCLAFGTRLPPP